MSSGSSRAVIANKMFELRTEVKDMLNKISQRGSLSDTEKTAYNAALDLYDAKKYAAAKEKLAQNF